VNTASRMESNGIPNKIHASLETAKLVIDSGRGHWVAPRDSLVIAKGKGAIQTYWLEPTSRGGPTTDTSTSNNHEKTAETALVDWTADILVSVTKQVIAHRPSDNTSKAVKELGSRKETRSVIDEFEDAIEIPRCNPEKTILMAASIELGESVKNQIYEFVMAISLAYRGECPSIHLVGYKIYVLS
jgi:Adenylate and Guanylate cyclase catalytic domain